MMFRQRRNRKTLYSTAEYWDSKALAYDDDAASMWPNRHLNQLYDKEQKQAIQGHVGPLAGRHLLDVGCGTGRLARWLAAQGAQVTGVDFSKGALEIARRNTKGENPSYRVCSVFELAYGDLFDVVLTWGVLAIACREREDLLLALTQIHDALRPGGKLILMEPVHSNFLHRVLKLSLNDFVSDVQSVGFRLQAISPLHFWPMRLILANVPLPLWITMPLYHIGQLIMKIPGFKGSGDYFVIVAHKS